MRYGRVPLWVVIGGCGLAYVGVFTAQCYAHEPDDCEPAPLGAATVFAPAMITATSSSVGAGASYYAPNMTGDEPVKVVQPKLGEIEQYALRALQPAGPLTFKPEVLKQIAAARAQSGDEDL
jgi:hypothetical protein